jgi:hypothetical protein
MPAAAMMNEHNYLIINYYKIDHLQHLNICYIMNLLLYITVTLYIFSFFHF